VREDFEQMTRDLPKLANAGDPIALEEDRRSAKSLQVAVGKFPSGGNYSAQHLKDIQEAGKNASRRRLTVKEARRPEVMAQDREQMHKLRTVPDTKIRSAANWGRGRRPARENGKQAQALEERTEGPQETTYRRPAS